MVAALDFNELTNVSSSIQIIMLFLSNVNNSSIYWAEML